jgi:hypothetical protein
VSEQAGIDLHSSNLAASNPFKKGLPQKGDRPGLRPGLSNKLRRLTEKAHHPDHNVNNRSAHDQINHKFQPDRKTVHCLSPFLMARHKYTKCGPYLAKV